MAELQTLKLKDGMIINASDFDASQHELASGQKAPQKDPSKLGPNERRVIMQSERAPSDVPTSDAIRVSSTVPVMKVRLHSSGQDVIINRSEFNPSLHTALLDDPVTRASSFTPSATDPLRAAGTGVVARTPAPLSGEIPVDGAAERSSRARASNLAASEAGESHYDASADAAEATRKATQAAVAESSAAAPVKASAKAAKASSAKAAAKSGKPAASRKSAK